MGPEDIEGDEGHVTGDSLHPQAFDPAFAAFARVTAALEGARSIDDVLRVIAREVGDLARVRRTSIHLRDEEAGLFRGCVGHAGDESIDAYIKRTSAGMPADGVTLELLSTKRPVIVANAHTDPRVIKATVRAWNIHSMMAVPMVLDAEVIGIIHLDDIERPHAFSAADAAIASAFAHLAAVAVANAKATIELRAKVDAAQRQVEALRRAAAVAERLSALVLSGASLQDLVLALSELLGKPCAVYDGDDVRLAVAAPHGADDGMLPRLLEPPCVDDPEVRSALGAGEGSPAFVVGPLPNAGVLHRYLVAPVVIDDKVWGRLVVMEHKRRFTGGDMLTMRRAATLLALQMSGERRAVEADWDAGASLTAELLAGCTERSIVQRRADRLGVRLDAPRVVAVIGPRCGHPATGDFRAAVAAFREVAPGADVLATAVPGGVAALVSLEAAPDDEPLVRAVRDIVAQVCARLGADVVAGVSSVRSGPDGYVEAHAEAREVLDCIRRFAPGPGHDVFSAADLGAGRVFLATSDREAVCRFAEATFGTLVRDPSKADLVATLRSFFDNMASIRRCALHLGVHENTIRYRLARIEELTGMPVTHDPDAQLRARLSMLVLMLQGRLPAGMDAPRSPARRPVVARPREVAVAAVR